jgi:hypothetical protein
MQNKIATLVVASLMAFTAHSQAFTTTMNLDILTPISGGSGIYTLRIGTYQGSLNADAWTAFNQLTTNFNTAYTVNSLAGSAISAGDMYSVVAATFTSPYSSAVGYDNSVYYWLTDTANTSFALLKGLETYWWDGAGLGSTDNFGIAADSVTTLFGNMNTSAGINSGVGALSATAIPEPTSASLFLLGAAGVLALRRQRKSNV